MLEADFLNNKKAKTALRIKAIDIVALKAKVGSLVGKAKISAK